MPAPLTVQQSSRTQIAAFTFLALKVVMKVDFEKEARDKASAASDGSRFECPARGVAKQVPGSRAPVLPDIFIT